jgi:TonB family protein
MILPWIKIEAMKTTVPQSFQAYSEFLWNMNDAVVLTETIEETTFNISWEYALLFGGMLLAALFFGYKLYQIYTLRQKGDVHYFKEFTQVVIANSSLAFSFFKSIFLGDKILDKEHKSILEHELVHIRQRHTYDLMFFELMRIVGWFNPLVYVYQSRVSELHEFIADAQVAKTNKKEQYQQLLSEVFQTQHISFINQFFKSSLIKKRIVMLQKTKSNKKWKFKYLILVPLIFGMLAYTSTEIEQKKIEFVEVGQTTEVIEVDDIENLSKQEENKIFKLLKSLSENSTIWELYVKDAHSTMKFIPSTDESYISGPNNERINAKLAIDSKLKSSELFELKATLERMKISPEEFHHYLNENQEFEKSFTLIGETVPFATVEKAPIFPGCEGEKDIKECFKEMILRHISKNFRYPIEAQNQGLQGMVSAIFMIADDGAITNIKTRGPDKVLEGEVERILNRLPTMTPGEDKGEKVNVMFSIPVTFKLGDKEEVGSEVSNHVIDGTVPFATIDEVPVFPGCENEDDIRACFQKSMQRHISKNFNYPKEAQEKGIQGRVSIMFVISEDGTIQNLRMKGPDALLEKEAARIISLLPKMTPGKEKGKAVNVPFSIPISFKLQEEAINNDKKLSSYNEIEPVYYIDGKEFSKEKAMKVLANHYDIESIFILKDKAARKKYGDKGKNGVVEVITKKKG